MKMVKIADNYISLFSNLLWLSIMIAVIFDKLKSFNKTSQQPFLSCFGNREL